MSDAPETVTDLLQTHGPRCKSLGDPEHVGARMSLYPPARRAASRRSGRTGRRGFKASRPERSEEGERWCAGRTSRR